MRMCLEVNIFKDHFEMSCEASDAMISQASILCLQLMSARQTTTISTTAAFLCGRQHGTHAKEN